MSPPRLAVSALAFPDTALATALARALMGYPAKACLPIVAVDSSIRLTDNEPGAELYQFLAVASEWESPLVRVFGGALPGWRPQLQLS